LVSCSRPLSPTVPTPCYGGCLPPCFLGSISPFDRTPVGKELGNKTRRLFTFVRFSRPCPHVVLLLSSMYTKFGFSPPVLSISSVGGTDLSPGSPLGMGEHSPPFVQRILGFHHWCGFAWLRPILFLRVFDRLYFFSFPVLVKRGRLSPSEGFFCWDKYDTPAPCFGPPFFRIGGMLIPRPWRCTGSVVKSLLGFPPPVSFFCFEVLPSLCRRAFLPFLLLPPLELCPPPPTL